MPLDSFSETKYKLDDEFLLRPSFRNRQFLAHLTTLFLLCAFVVFIIVKARAHFSLDGFVWMAFSLWMAFSMFWIISLYRMLLHRHARLQMVLAMEQVDMHDIKPPLGVALHVIRDISIWALHFSFFSIFFSLMAILTLLRFTR